MKNSIAAALLGFDLVLFCAATACDPLQSDDNVSPPRSQTEITREKSGTQFSSGDVLAVAVSFPSDYDWHRDTSFGAVNAKIVFQCNGKTQYSFDAGRHTRVSTDADSHHILDGRLYSESRDADSTYIYQDGVPYISFAGREIIKGIVHSKGSPYILSQKCSGEGFVLRYGGETIFERDSGTVTGDLSDPFCDASGALYEDSRSICFTYYCSGGSGERDWYLVEDGEEKRILSPVDAVIVYDVRRINGSICCVYRGKSAKSLYFQDGDSRTDLSKTIRSQYMNDDYRIICYNKSASVVGTSSSRYDSVPTTYIWNANGLAGTFEGDCYIYRGKEKSSILVFGEDEDIFYSPESRVELEPDFKLMTSRCAVSAENGVYLSLSPVIKGRHPKLWHDGKSSSLDINGFFAAMEVLD